MRVATVTIDITLQMWMLVPALWTFVYALFMIRDRGERIIGGSLYTFLYAVGWALIAATHWLS